MSQANETPTVMNSDSPLLDQRALSKLKWRCRRGLLENDLFIEQFFLRHENELTVRQAEALGVLMDLSDNDLLDLLLGRKQPQDDAGGLEILMDLSDNDLLDLFLARKEPQGELDRPDVRQVLHMVRAAKADSPI
mgnify:CR=1 FL=1